MIDLSPAQARPLSDAVDDAIAAGARSERLAVAFSHPPPSPSPTRTHLDTVRLRFYDAVDVRRWTKRQWLCLRVIRTRSFDRGQARAWIPTLGHFAAETGLDRAEVSRGIDELDAARVIDAPVRSDGTRVAGWYGINVQFSSWSVPERRITGESEQLWNGLQEPEDDLAQALRQTFIGSDLSPGTGAAPSDHQHPLQRPAGDVVTRPAGQPMGSPSEALVVDGGAGCLPAPPSTVGIFPTTPIPTNDSTVARGPVGIFPTVQPGNLRVSPHTPLPGTGTGTGLQRLNRFSELRSTGSTVEPVSPRTNRDQPRPVGKIPTRSVSPAEECGLMRELHEFFAVPSTERWENEMSRSGAFWRLTVIRNVPDALITALAEGIDLDRTGYAFRWKPAWLQTITRKHAGLDDWSRVGKRPSR